MPLLEDSPSTPLISQDEGYGHGVSIDSMTVTPRVGTLGEQLPNVELKKGPKVKLIY